MPERPHNDPPTDRIVPDPTARIPVGDAARTPRWPIPYRVFLHRSGRYPYITALKEFVAEQSELGRPPAIPSRRERTSPLTVSYSGTDVIARRRATSTSPTGISSKRWRTSGVSSRRQ